MSRTDQRPIEASPTELWSTEPYSFRPHSTLSSPLQVSDISFARTPIRSRTLPLTLLLLHADPFFFQLSGVYQCGVGTWRCRSNRPFAVYSAPTRKCRSTSLCVNGFWITGRHGHFRICVATWFDSLFSSCLVVFICILLCCWCITL